MIPLVVRRLLRPLRSAAHAAGAIDIRSLDQRLPLVGLPTELRPLVAAINAALDRLDAGFARQRLFTANAAHELRTPVAILQARVDALPQDAPSRSDLARDARRIALLIDQLLAVARLGHSEVATTDTIDLVALVRGLVADCAPLAIRAGRRVAFDAPAGPVHVTGNAQALSSAVANLIDNALRAEPAGGTVEVVVTERAEIVVVDHGPGIAAEDRPFVFEPFWRKDERTPGTGLGLAIASDVTALHGGTLTVAETPGGGATFRLALPSAPAPTRPTRQTGAMNG
jgi:signal transduction histidine kinase